MFSGERVFKDKTLAVISGAVFKHPLSKPSVCIGVDLKRSDCMGPLIKNVKEAVQDTMNERQLIHANIGNQGDMASSNFQQVCLDDKVLKPAIEIERRRTWKRLARAVEKVETVSTTAIVKRNFTEF